MILHLEMLRVHDWYGRIMGILFGIELVWRNEQLRPGHRQGGVPHVGISNRSDGDGEVCLSLSFGRLIGGL